MANEENFCFLRPSEHMFPQDLGAELSVKQTVEVAPQRGEVLAAFRTFLQASEGTF